MSLLRQLDDLRRVSVETLTESLGDLYQVTVCAIVIGGESTETMHTLWVACSNVGRLNVERLSSQMETLPSCDE